MFTAGVAGQFVVSSTPGVPEPRTITETGVLPTGVTFTNNVDGGAVLFGTAAATAVGSYPVTITVSNGIAPDAIQQFVLYIAATATVSLPPTAPTSNGALTITPPTGTTGQTVTVSGPGSPAGRLSRSAPTRTPWSGADPPRRSTASSPPRSHCRARPGPTP